METGKNTCPVEGGLQGRVEAMLMSFPHRGATLLLRELRGYALNQSSLAILFAP